MLSPNLHNIFLLACCYQLLVAAARRPAAFLAFGERFKWDVPDEFILRTETTNPTFSCGIHINETFYYFSIFIEPDHNSTALEVWTANRDTPLDNSPTLRLADGNLELVDGGGKVVWSTGTYGKHVVAMKLEETGNLVLLDAENRTLWKSFDHPADTLVAGQMLQGGQRLTSSTNSAGASYSVLMEDGDLNAFIDTDPPRMYLQLQKFSKVLSECRNNRTADGIIYEKLLDSTTEDCDDTTPVTPQILITASISGNMTKITTSLNHFIKLESDGRLMVYYWSVDFNKWESVEFINRYSDRCSRPLICGPFSVCKLGQCSCLALPYNETQYFQYLDKQHPNLGCEEINPVSCNKTSPRTSVDFSKYSYLPYIPPNATKRNRVGLEGCHEACLSNCSCKAILFSYMDDSTRGSCHLLDGVFLIAADTLPRQKHVFQVFLKESGLLQGGEQDKKHNYLRFVVGVAFGSLAVVNFVFLLIMFLVRRKRADEEDAEEDELEQVPGMVLRKFSHEELKMATRNFQMILGQGGFASVFMGVLNNGMPIAVKRLDNTGKMVKEFLAEVKIIGSIHHMNLVRLVGFCAKKSQRLLVSEYMPNGSLDRWIFLKNNNRSLDWKTRMNIIIGTAKGLCYLHEECSQKIAHLDIKPQNILLDEKYNAKISDFGLSRLISRDESQVVTAMRGTPGYLAPEWLNASISEKADVYSFGVLIMEVICKRRNLDPSQPEGRKHLLKLLQSVAQENQLLDLADMTDDERLSYGEEAVTAIRIAMRCLQNDYTRRPLMSSVVKALEGTKEPDDHIEFCPFYAVDPVPVSQTQTDSEIQTETQSFLRSVPR